MKSLWATLLIWHNLSVCISQSTFQTEIPDFGSSVAFAEYNNSVFAACTQLYTDTSGFFVAKTRLVKLDPYGNILFDTIYAQTPYDDFYPVLIATSDGGCILASESLSYPDPNHVKAALIWKITPDGIIEWQKTIGTIVFEDAISTSDERYLFLNMDLSEADTLGLIELYKTDLDGNILWVTQMGDTDKSIFPSITSTNPINVKEINGDYFVTAYRTGSSLINGRLYKISSDGELIWEIRKQATDEVKYNQISLVFQLNKEYFFNCGEGLYKFDPETGENWKITNFPAWANDNGYNFEVVCNELALVTNSGDVVSLKKYDNVFEPYYEKALNNVTGTGGYYLNSTDGGSIIFTGNSGTLQITKTDCMGNDYWSDECNSKIPTDADMIIYPNPSQSEILIEADFDFYEVVIYLVNGQMVEYINSCACPRMKLNISDFAAGVYVVRITDANQNAISRFIKL